MSLGIIVKKEVKELLTVQTILPVVLMSFLFASLGGMIGDVEEEVEELPLVGVVDLDGSVLSGVAVAVIDQNAELLYNGTSPDEGLDELEAGDGDALLVIPEGFQASILGNETGVITVTWLMKGAGLLDSISTAVVEGLLITVDDTISAVLIESQQGLNSSVVLNPTARNETTVFKDREMEGVSPSALANIMSGQSLTVPLIIMMLIMMSGSTVISSMALEKENKTLETLLTLPVRRTSIVAGKIIGSALVGLLMAVIFMAGFGMYMTSFSTMTAEGVEVELSLSALDLVLVGASMFVALLAGLAISMLLGTFAKNFKSVQTLTFPLVGMALVPMFITMFKDFDTLPVGLQVLVFLIPFSHPMMAVRALMFDDYVLVLGGIAYAAVFSVVIILLVVRIFSTDKLLTGRISARGEGAGGRLPILRLLGR